MIHTSSMKPNHCWNRYHIHLSNPVPLAGSLWNIISFCHFSLTNPIRIYDTMGPTTCPDANRFLSKRILFQTPLSTPMGFSNPKSSLLWMKLQKSNKVNTTRRQQKLARKKAKLNSNWFRRVLGIAGGRFKTSPGTYSRQ